MRYISAPKQAVCHALRKGGTSMSKPLEEVVVRFFLRFLHQSPFLSIPISSTEIPSLVQPFPKPRSRTKKTIRIINPTHTPIVKV